MSHEKQYYGLAPGVRFRRELGFIFVDDRRKTFQLSESLFFKILSSPQGGAYSEGSKTHATIFKLFPTLEEALKSVQSKEI